VIGSTLVQSVVLRITALKALYSATSGGTLIGWIHSLVNAIARTLSDRNLDTVSVFDFMTPEQIADVRAGTASVNVAAAIQNALGSLNTRGGGRLIFPWGKYLIGTTGLTTYGNVLMVGEGTRYAGSTTRGTSIVYSGTGNALYGQNLLDSSVENLDFDCTATTGAAVKGIYFNGVWKSALRNVTVRGVTPAKGYGILFDTNTGGGPWGGQHNVIEQCECADGIVRFFGSSGSDGVTTTLVHTFRGMQYQIVSSQIVFLNATAEAWGAAGNGYDFSGAGCNCTMLGCDIENNNAGAVGIAIAAPASVREIGTIWAGFSGTTRVSGFMDTLRSYGGAFSWTALLVAGTAVLLEKYGDSNNDTYVSEELVPDNITGGSQGGHRRWKRYINGAQFIDHEFGEHAFIKKTIATAATTAQTVWTIPVPASEGLRLSVHAHGTQAGNVPFSNYRECVVMNNGGALTITAQAQQTAGDAGALNFTASGASVLVTWTPTLANASNPNFNLEIRGPWVSYV
jgi:hypothetical protein